MEQSEEEEEEWERRARDLPAVVRLSMHEHAHVYTHTHTVTEQPGLSVVPGGRDCLSSRFVNKLLSSEKPCPHCDTYKLLTWLKKGVFHLYVLICVCVRSVCGRDPTGKY